MCEGECSNHVEESNKSFHQEERIIVVQAIIDNLFEEALISEYPRSMKEDTTPLRRNVTLLLGGMRATRSSSMRFTEPQGRTEEPPV
jgi:hypothetical protein